MDLIITTIFSFLFTFDFIFGIIFFVLFIINCEIIFLQAVGIQCSLPLFEERSKNAYLISYIILLIQFLSLLLTLNIIIPLMPNSIDITMEITFILANHMILTMVVSFFLFLYGLKKLKHFE